MKNLIKKTIILLAAALAVACTRQPANHIDPELVLDMKFLSAAELKDVEAVLNNNDTKHYGYRVVRVQKQNNGGSKLEVVKEDSFNGLLFMYNKERLSPLGGAFYTDEQGGLLEFGGQKKVFAMNRVANGKDVLAIDGDRDGVIETVVANIDTHNFWIASDDIAALLPCLSSSSDDIYDAAYECTKPQLSGGGGQTGGGSGDSPGLGSSILGEPDCTSTKPGSVVDGDPETPPGEDPAPPPPPPSTKSPDDEDYPPMGRHETFSTEGDGRQTRVVTIRNSEKLVVQVTGTAEDGSVIRTTIHRDSQGRETYREDIMIGPAPDRRLLMHRVNRTTYDADGNPSSTLLVSRQARSGSSLPPVNPDGSTVFEDPRCAGREARASQGLSFLDLCIKQGSTDFLTCYRQLENPLYNVSGGRCEVDEGPAGGEVLRCSDNESIVECIAAGGSPAECAEREPGEDPIVGPGGPGSGPTDGPSLPGTSGSIDIKFIDTIPLGAVLMGICSRGGCPDPRPF